MGIVDASVLALLAIADMVFLLHLRRARARRLRDQRMMRYVRLAVVGAGACLPGAARFN